MPQTPSTRWCPTPEQLMILEEMYRSGVRTPNAAEIQQITAHLAYYGRIEGKNVFYWFQNHKARERQRLRRRLCARHQQQCAQLGVAAASAPAAAAAAAAAGASTGNGVVGGVGGGGGGGGGGVHPAVMQLHHQSYATSSLHQSFMAQGYFQQDASAAAAHPAGMNLVGKISECTDPDAAACGAYDHRDWVQMTDGGCSASSSGEAMAMPPCCRPLKTLELFPTKSTGLKDECSSSKSSSCSTSTN